MLVEGTLSKSWTSNVFVVTLETLIHLPLTGSEARGYAVPGELTPTLTVMVVPVTADIARAISYAGSVARG